MHLLNGGHRLTQIQPRKQATVTSAEQGFAQKSALITPAPSIVFRRVLLKITTAIQRATAKALEGSRVLGAQSPPHLLLGAARIPILSQLKVGYLNKWGGNQGDIWALGGICHLLRPSFSGNIGDEFANGPGL